MKKFISLLMILLVLVSVCFTTAFAYPFYTCNGFSYYLMNGKAVITDYNLETEVLYIPDVLDGNVVSAISDGAFVDNSHIRKVFIAEGIESIGEYAFYNCPNLSAVTVAGSKTTIGDRAFCFEPFYKDGQYWADTTVDDDEITFYGYGYSHLKKFANTYRYKYVDLGYESYTCGDTDYDNEVTVKDATQIQKSLAGIIYFVKKRMNLNADFNRDKLVDIRDATAIQQYVAGLDYHMETRRVYLDAPEIWTGSEVYLQCTSVGYVSAMYTAEYDESTDHYYADIPAIVDYFYVSSDYEAEVYSNRITVPEEDSFHIKCISYENWGLWTEYKWEFVYLESAIK